MSELREKAAEFEELIKKAGTEKYTFTISESEKQELNVENGEFKLLRTVFGYNASLKIFKGAKMGSVNGNDVSKEGLEKLVEEGGLAADSAPEDPCHDFAPNQGSHVFRQGVSEPDMDLFLERIKEFLKTAAEEYPLVKIMSVVGSFDKWNWISRNTNGTEFEGFGGQYSVSVTISASDGERNSGINGTGFVTADLSKPIIEMADVKKQLEDIQKSIRPENVDGKFEGTVIFTPGCAANFISMLVGNYMSGSVIIDGTSLWLDKVGEQVSSEKLTVSLDPFDERIVMGDRATADGFIAEKVALIDKGVLKNHTLDLYASNKTGRPMIKNTGWDLIIEPGDKTLEEMIASVDKGLLMGGFSGGEPGTNGEFSGVAKNSFLIENGKIKCAVSETMVNGNLAEAFKNVRSISKEQVCDGGSAVPYIAVDGIVISGK